MSESDREVILFGSGKLLLFGEHAAVYGYPAIGTSLSAGVTLTLRPAGPWQFPDGAGTTRKTFERFVAHLERVHASLGDEGVPLSKLRGTVDIHSSIPISGGFGSSAALCAALAAGMAPTAPLRDRWRTAHELERFFHGTPSGIDTGLSVLGGTRYFTFPEKGALPKTEELPSVRGVIVAGALPRRSSTGELVAEIRARLEAGERSATVAIERLGSLAERAAFLLKQGAQIEEIGAMASEAHARLKELGVSTEGLDRTIEFGKKLGALGGKLSGAGGGGAFYLLFDDTDRADTAHRRLAEEIPELFLLPADRRL